MQHGVLKYDGWERLIWAYNSIDVPIRTHFTGKLVGICANEKSVKYTNLLTGEHLENYYSGDFNAYCGCYKHSVNALEPYEDGLIVSKCNEVVILSRNGERCLKLLDYRSEYQITNGDTYHIACGLLSCSNTNPRIVLSSNSGNVYTVDAFSGQIDGTIKVADETLKNRDGCDRITALADFVGNNSTSSCLFSYYLAYSDEDDRGYNSQYSLSSNAQLYKEWNYDRTFRSKSSLKEIRKKFGSVDAIPEFIPADAHKNPLAGTKTFRTIGSMSLECAMMSQRYPGVCRSDFRDLTCLGMSSGVLHVIDHRVNKIVSTINAHNRSICGISAGGNTIATIGCSLYENCILYEPLVEIHDMRLQRTRSLWLGSAVSRISIVPKSDRLFALQPYGDLYDCKLSTLEFTEVKVDNTETWPHYGMELVLPKETGCCEIYSVNAAYCLNKTVLPNELDPSMYYDLDNLPEKFRKIDSSKVRQLNKTPFASMVGTFDGDLAHIIVQVFFFLSHLDSLSCHICEVEHCITCQVGFALHMLKIAHNNRKIMQLEGNGREGNHDFNSHCDVIQVTQLQELAPLDGSETIAHSFQKLLLWLIEKMNSELENCYGSMHGDFANNAYFMKNIFGSCKKIEFRCPKGHSWTKVLGTEFCIKYKNLFGEKVLKEMGTSYCTKCASKALIESKITFETTPNVLIVDCTTEPGGEIIEHVQKEIEFNGDIYYVASVLFSVPSDDPDDRILSCSKYSSADQPQAGWVLINDGIVMELESEDEIGDMFDFSEGWKKLIGVIYTKKSCSVKEILPTFLDDTKFVSVKGRIVPLPIPSKLAPIPPSIFISESNIAHNPEAHKSCTFVPLSVNELLEIQNSGFTLALDVECVKTDVECDRTNHSSMLRGQGSSSTLQDLEMTKSTFTSSERGREKNVSAIARVTAVRASGSAAGVPFLDHYIHRRRPPKDYLTRFSGIHQGDLDLKSSLHWLTTKKSIYLKIRYLVDVGCTFLGHGLEQDFKMLNIVVPTKQIIDTVELFRIPRQRYLSLQFLAAHLLHRKIQSHEHDSIEDARTALDLYRAYLHYEKHNRTESVIRRLYDIGYRTNWSV